MLKRLAQIELAIAGGLLVGVVGLVFFAAVARFFGRPLIWSIDLAQLLFIWLCMIGATRAMREKGHLGIDLVVRFLPQATRFALEVALSLVILVFFALLTVEGTKLAVQNVERTFGDSGISYAWVTMAVPVGCILLGIALVYNLVDAWRRRTEGVLVYSRAEISPAPSSEL